MRQICNSLGDGKMKLCEKINDKLIFFEDLNEEEKHQIQVHLDDCKNCREKLRDFQNIMSAIETNHEHPIEDELLTRYSIYLAAPGEADYDGKKLTRSEIGRIRKHVFECQVCEEKIEQFTREYREIENYLDETDLPELILGPRPALTRLSDLLQQLYNSVILGIKDLANIPMPKLYPVALGAVAALFIMIWVGPFFRGSENPYLKLVPVDKESASFLTRSRLSQTLAEGLAAFSEGEMERAIQRLQGFISTSADDPTLFYAHYVLGIAYLNQAKSDFLGRFQQVNSKLVDAGIENLELAKSLSQNPNITEGCNWHIGVAYLMKGDGSGAKTMFEQVVELRGRRFKEAKEMLSEIERSQQSK